MLRETPPILSLREDSASGLGSALRTSRHRSHVLRPRPGVNHQRSREGQIVDFNISVYLDRPLFSGGLQR